MNKHVQQVVMKRYNLESRSLINSNFAKTESSFLLRKIDQSICNVYLTAVRPPFDTFIFHKQEKMFIRAGYEKFLFNNLFEYMVFGLPVIASNFPLWKEIVEGNNCGICVDPLNSKAIAEAIEYLVTHPEKAKKMGENGRRVVVEKYNWEREKEKLIKLYEEALTQ